MPVTPEPATDPLPALRPEAPMAPVVALRRIAYLMDRDLAESRKVRAFHHAADVADQTGEAELARLGTVSALTRLPGIGDSTGTVIAQALAGEVPERLATLEAGGPPEPSAEVRAVLDATRGDCHLHTHWSDGATSIAEMAGTARVLGRSWMALTDHSPRLTVAHGLSPERLAAQLEEVAALNEDLAPFRILTGMEVDILEDGSLDLDDELLARLDLVVGSVHSKLRMDRRAMTRRLVRAVSSPHVDVLGHCTGRLVNRTPGVPEDVDPKRPPSTFDADVVFAACAQTDTAVELNSRPERLDPPDDLLAVAVEAGCRFTIDTDAHAPGQLEWQRHGADKAVRVGVPADRIVTSWPVEQVLDWTEQHGT